MPVRPPGASRPIRKITVLGAGGVGGLLAGQLIRQYGDAVSLVARGRPGRASAPAGPDHPQRPVRRVHPCSPPPLRRTRPSWACRT